MMPKAMMPKAKSRKDADFGDILAALDQNKAKEERADPAEGEQGETIASRKGASPAGKPLLRFLQSLSLPWQSRLAGLISGLGLRQKEAYTQEASCPDPPPHPAAAEGQTATADSPAPVREKSEDESIAEELGLSARLGLIDLKRIRRDFARKNHPDRFEPARRSSAERRMSIANMLIDEQIRQNRKRECGGQNAR